MTVRTGTFRNKRGTVAGPSGHHHLTHRGPTRCRASDRRGADAPRLVGRGLVAVWWVVMACVLGACAEPGKVLERRGPEPRDAPDARVRLNGPIAILEDERASHVWVVDGDAHVDGVIEDSLWVVRGDADIRGEVLGNVTVMGGTLHVLHGGRVRHARVIDGEIDLDPGAHIHSIERLQTEPWRRRTWGVSLLVWIGVTLTLMGIGWVWTQIAPGLVPQAAKAVRSEPFKTAFTGLGVLLLAPLVAVPFVLSGIFAPVGMFWVFLVLPTLGGLGYVLSGILLGFFLLRRWEFAGEAKRGTLAALSGMLVLQLATAIPWLGGLVFVGAMALGTGVLVRTTWRSVRVPLMT